MNLHSGSPQIVDIFHQKMKKTPKSVNGYSAKLKLNCTHVLLSVGIATKIMQKHKSERQQNKEVQIVQLAHDSYSEIE